MPSANAPRQPFGEVDVEGEARLVRTGKEHLGLVGPSTFEPPQRDAQRVFSTPRAARLHHFGKCARRLTTAHRGETGAHDVAVQRVAHSDLLARALRHDLDQAAPLELVDDGGGNELLEVAEPDRLADAHHFERVALGVAETTQTESHHLAETRRRRQRAAQAPQPVRLLECAGVDRPDDELAQEERVPATRRPERVRGSAVDRTTERLGDHALDVVR